MFIPMDAKFSGTCGFLGVSVSRDTKHQPWDRAFFSTVLGVSVVQLPYLVLRSGNDAESSGKWW